jgi:hypothetical protein
MQPADNAPTVYVKQKSLTCESNIGSGHGVRQPNPITPHPIIAGA